MTESERPRFELRGATAADEDSLLSLAAHLNTVNLPNDRQAVRELLTHAEQSFVGTLAVEHRKYVWLLWDHHCERAIGTSALIARLGRRDAPYIYFDVIDEERYARSVDKHFHHTLLRLGFSYAGPTELGGLVLDPSYRGSAERLGRFASYARFGYLAAHRACFQDQLLAELLPPLEPDGTSHLWEALGRRFTEMSYEEADRLSSSDKDFIRDLFPRGVINTTLMEPHARQVVGQVGAKTLGVERMLRAIGFRYARRVDPFDGGPHFVAPTDEVSLVRDTVTAPYTGPLPLAQADTASRGIVLHFQPTAPYVIGVQSSYVSGAEGFCLPEAMAQRLGVSPGGSVTVTPLPADKK
jgi:arginine N-succinyltransferase